MTPLRSRASAVIFRTATTRAATLSIGTISVCALALISCGSDDAPEKVTDVRWQVTAVGDAAYDAPAQARTWIVLGSNTVTGGSGCERFNGKVDWSGSDDSGRITLSDVSTTTEDDCAPADSYNAEQISSILNTPDLRWTFDDGKGSDDSSGNQENSTMRHLRLWVDGSPEQGISFAG